MRLPILVAATVLFALPVFAQQQPQNEQDWSGIAASLQQQLMEAMSNRMQRDAQMLRQLQAANARASAAEAKVSEMEKRLAAPAIPTPGPAK